MNLRQLEILRAVIRHRTTVAAADELALSQPAISNALKAMEAQAGFALFERVNNRLFPTTEAMALYKESDAIFALHAKLENRVRDLRENRTGHLSIVATPPLAYSIIPPALSNFLRRRQQTRVFFDVRRYEGIIEGVTSRVAELGFALGLSHHPGIAHEVVHTGEMVCVLPPKHPLAEQPVITAADLVGSALHWARARHAIGRSRTREFCAGRRAVPADRRGAILQYGLRARGRRRGRCGGRSVFAAPGRQP